MLCQTVGRPLQTSESIARQLGVAAARCVVSLGWHGVRGVGDQEIFALAGDEPGWG